MELKRVSSCKNSISPSSLSKPYFDGRATNLCGDLRFVRKVRLVDVVVVVVDADAAADVAMVV